MGRRAAAVNSPATRAPTGLAAASSAAAKMAEPRAVADKIDEEICLLGQPPLEHYLDFVRHTVIGGADINRTLLADEWRAANDHYYELEQSEAGIADSIDCHELNPGLEPLVEEVKGDPRFRETFDTLPTSFGMVELDKLVVFQTRVTRPFVTSLAARVENGLDSEALFRFCMPLGHRDVPVRIRRISSRRYIISSESNDLRFHEAVFLRPGQIRGYETFGSIAGVLGLVVGFGSSFLNVIRSDARIVLNNGYHRACALRAAGVTHAPCVIQTVTRRDELQVAGNDDLNEDPAFYFKAARPPLLKDFFNPRIRKVLPTYRMLRMIELTFEVQDFAVAD